MLHSSGIKAIFLLAGLTLFLFSACSPDQSPDLIITNAHIVTVDESLPEAEALAIRNGVIIAVGDAATIAEMSGRSTRVVDAGGRLVTPGFIDAHAHFWGVGSLRLQLDLLGKPSWQSIVDAVAAAVEQAEPGDLIVGRGWHQNDWLEAPARMIGDLPHHEKLSAVSPNNPVILTHASGHMTFANAYAMELLGITAETADPAGGEIVREVNGDPAGPFRQRASNLLAPLRNSWEPDMAEVVRMAEREALSLGITTFGDAGTPVHHIREMMRVHAQDPLQVRLHLMVRDRTEVMTEALPELAGAIEGDPFFRVSGIKRAIDGALGTHGAWMLEPYADNPGTAGFNTTPLETIREAGELALQHGLQLAVHAIGDRGNREALDLYEALFEEHGVYGPYLRWRIEHAQNLHPDDVPRFRELGVIASMQGVHATSDGPWVARRISEARAQRGAYIWRTLLENGVTIINGTDAPVERLNPMHSFHSSVTRLMPTGEVFFGEQVMTREEALRSYTLDSAFGIFREHDLGSLTPGKLADIVIWSGDFMRGDADTIRDILPVMTFVGGELVFEAE